MKNSKQEKQLRDEIENIQAHSNGLLSGAAIKSRFEFLANGLMSLINEAEQANDKRFVFPLKSKEVFLIAH